MRYQVDPKQGKKAYLQLYEQLRQDIVSGALGYQSRLPSKRMLAEEAGSSVITVEHAYSLLCDEGYVEARQRRGYFVIYREGELFSHSPLPSASAPAPAVVGSAGSADEFPFSVYAKAVRRVLSDYKESLLVKGENRGCMELRLALSHYLARAKGIHAEPDQIIIGSGAEYFYSLVVHLLGRDRGYAVEDPSYAPIARAYRVLGAQIRLLPLGQDGIESAALLATSARVLHITPYQSFPSGVTAGASKKREYLRWSEAQEGRFLVEDDFQSEFTLSTKHEETLFSLSRLQNVIYMNTFSKTVSPSIRVAYMVLPRRLLADFEEKLGFYSCPVPRLSQLVIAQLIAGGDFERHVNRVRRKKRRAEEKKK